MLSSKNLVPGYSFKMLDGIGDIKYFATFVVEKIIFDEDQVSLRKLKTGELITVPRMLAIVAGYDKTPRKK